MAYTLNTVGRYKLQASPDGTRFFKVVNSYDTADQSLAADAPPLEETHTFPAVTARYFRLLLKTPRYPPISPDVASGLVLGPKPTKHRVTQLVLYVTPRVDHFEQKAGFFLDAGRGVLPAGLVSSAEVVRRGDIVDLTSQLRPDGALSWTAPAGQWVILRAGYSLLGITNHPASPEGTGLEVDKLSRASVRDHMDDYLGRYESMLGTGLVGASGLHAMVNDSWEAGPQNWTPGLPREFVRRRGYELIPWLPALTGRVIGSAEETDRFLWDFRRTLGDLVAENHYGQIATSLHERHLVHYVETHEQSRAFVGDGMDAKRNADIPMGAMWIGEIPPFTQRNSDADIRESASVAHIYGQNLVAAESMTVLGIPGAAYAFSPETLKPTADRELADGVNLFVIHASVHQPLIATGPGLTLGPFGQWFTRQETWARQAAPWVSYLARSAYLLQQGHFVADILYYYGQDSNITALYGHDLPAIPNGFAFDFANAHVLRKLSVKEGSLVTASGMHYRVLALDPRTRLMSLDVLKEIERLVKAGATVVGDQPEETPSLADDMSEFRGLAVRLWGNEAAGEHRYGAGRILAGSSITDAMATLKVPPDFTYSTPCPDTTIWFVHRHLVNGDLYFVNNRLPRAEQLQASFRLTGVAPELWHADTGQIEPASYRVEADHTIVPLKLEAQDAVFVVFRTATDELKREVPERVRRLLSPVGGPWTVHFPAGRGAPEQAAFPELASWTANADPGIRFFSGTATYTTSMSAQASWFAEGHRVEIDLGTVKNIAEVLVNGQSAGIVWKRPFRIDLTRALHPGLNQLEIRVTNLWPNRLIGDKQPNVKPVAFAPFNPYSANSPLLDSGLLGPVVMLDVKQHAIRD